MLVLALVKNMNIRVIEVIATPIPMTIAHLFVSILSPHAFPFPFTTITFANLSDPLSSILAQGHAYILSILILVWGECHVAPMYVHVLRLLCFSCIKVRPVCIEPFLSREAAFNWPRGPQPLSSHYSVSVRTLSYS
jgi:hypothetical protein